MPLEDKDQPFDVSRRINALRKAGELSAACTLAEEGLLRWPGDAFIFQAFGWCRYDGDVKALDTTDAVKLGRAESAARWIVENVRDISTEPYRAYDPRPLSVIQTAKAHGKARRFTTAVDLLHLLDPSRLADRVDNEHFEPLRTQWFGIMTAALHRLDRWPELLALSRSPMRSTLRGPGVQWIEYRFALACIYDGRPDDALTGLDIALRGKNDPWVKALRAQVLSDLDRSDQAITLLRQALASTRNEEDLGFLIGAMRQMVGLLKDTDHERAAGHARMIARVRSNLGWPLKQIDRDTASEVGVNLTSATDEEYAQLRVWWKAAVSIDRKTGSIKTRLPPHRRSGFVTADDGLDYFFQLPKSQDGEAPPEGTRVSFELGDGFDKKKNVASKVAMRVRRI